MKHPLRPSCSLYNIQLEPLWNKKNIKRLLKTKKHHKMLHKEHVIRLNLKKSRVILNAPIKPKQTMPPKKKVTIQLFFPKNQSLNESPKQNNTLTQCDTDECKTYKDLRIDANTFLFPSHLPAIHKKNRSIIDYTFHKHKISEKPLSKGSFLGRISMQKLFGSKDSSISKLNPLSDYKPSVQSKNINIIQSYNDLNKYIKYSTIKKRPQFTLKKNYLLRTNYG